MSFQKTIKFFCNQITVAVVTGIFFLSPSFFQSQINNEYIHNPLFWILILYWGVALFLYTGIDESKRGQNERRNNA